MSINYFLGIDDFIAIAPRSTNPIKDWPYYEKLIERLNENVVVLGSKPCNYKNVIDLSGKTSLLEMGEVIRRAKLFIGGCSGPLHIAGAFGTPIIAIYTSTSPDQWAPRHNTTVLYKKLPCSPCINKGVKCEHNECLSTIGVDEVYNAYLTKIKKPLLVN